MKLVARILAVFAVLALATPALACGEKADKNTKSVEAKPTSSEKVAKSGEKKTSGPAKQAAEPKPATASN